jgi:transposase InsO family protein
VLRAKRAARTAVLELLGSIGPGVGLAVLQGQFPELPGAELADLLKRYRRVWQRRHGQVLHVLHWQRAGAVWAMDYALPPLPLEEGYSALLAVRDLASGQQLLWLPVAEATAATTVDALLWLFTLYGAPLVLKMDNGSPFVAAATRALLAQWQVQALWSPPRRPQYNGAIEAGIGSLKGRTHYQAARGGHAGQWTLADAEAARAEANTLGRPWGAHGPTPAERWQGRQPLTAAERSAFAASVAQRKDEAARAAAAAPPAGAPAAEAEWPPAAERTATRAPAGAEEPRCEQAGSARTAPRRDEARADQASRAESEDAEGSRPSAEWAATQRQAISRALVAHGYLLFTRRRIPLPITRKKVSMIT